MLWQQQRQYRRDSSSDVFLFSQLFLPQEAVGGSHALQYRLFYLAEAVVVVKD